MGFPYNFTLYLRDLYLNDIEINLKPSCKGYPWFRTFATHNYYTNLNLTKILVSLNIFLYGCLLQSYCKIKYYLLCKNLFIIIYSFLTCVLYFFL